MEATVMGVGKTVQLAKRLIENHQHSDKKSMDTKLRGYIYVSKSTLQDIEKNEGLASPYVQFDDYLNCAPDQRDNHPWKDVYLTHGKDVAHWCNKEFPTDSDYYSYFIWKSAKTFGKDDITAGARAIYFSWTKMPYKLHKALLESEHGARYTEILEINLASLCNDFGGSIRYVEFSTTSARPTLDFEYTPISPVDAVFHAKRKNLWVYGISPRNILARLPHGCIIMPSGLIPKSCIRHFPTDKKP